MKSILFLTCFTLFSTAAFCQNYCDDIEKITRPNNSTIVYHSKYFSGEPITVWKIRSRFFIAFRTNGEQLLPEKGLNVTLSDGSKIALPNTVIHTGTLHTSKGFTYEATLYITDKNVAKLTSAYIVNFALGNLKRNVPKIWGERYMNYVQCIKNKVG